MSDKPSRGGITRRDALKLGLGAAGLACLDIWNVRAWAGNLSAKLGAAEGAASYSPIRPRAKSVIQLWMWGGPSHLDTFDPKPKAGYDYCGPFDKPIQTNVPGIEICQLLPLLAKQADKYSILRSVTHGVNSHETAAYIVQTGHTPGRLVYPGAGAVVSFFKGVDHGYKGLAPPYIVLTRHQGRFSESGFLGEKYQAFATGGDPNRTPFVVEGIVAQGVSDERQRERRKLLHDLDSLGHAMPKDAAFEQFDRSEDKAYNMMFGETRKLFDLSNEKAELRDKYGRNTFGQSCLMARRLVESGVPYVTINSNGWDTHKQNFEVLRRKLPELDQGMATLLQDLSDRGLLDTTIVWWGGEFGRTPKIMWNPPWNGGRGHWGQCFSVVLAGGGFKGGHVVGASDAKGEYVAKRPIHPRDILASIYTLMGISPAAPLPNPRGTPVPVLPPPAADDPEGGLLREIMS